MAWERLKEGDPFTGDSLGVRLDYIQNRLNDLPSISVERKALSYEHLPSTVFAKAHAVLDSSTAHTYNDNSEPYPGWNTMLGWRTINTDGSLASGKALRAIFPSLVDTSNPSYRILILANVNLLKIEEVTSGAVSGDYYAMFAIHVRDSAGTWHHIARTERYTDADWHVNPDTYELSQLADWKDIPIRCLILPSDGIGMVSEVRMVVSVVDATAAHASQLVQVTLREGNLTALAFQCGVL